MSDENEKLKLELVTEFDRMLAPIRRKVFYTIGTLLAFLTPFEIILIFVLLTDSGKLGLQTFHGFAVGAGGLVVISVSMLLVLLPTKLMSYRAYKKSEEAAGYGAEMVKSVRETATKVDSFIIEGREAFAEMKRFASGAKLDELTVRLERKLDEHFGANDPPLSEEELAVLERNAKG